MATAWVALGSNLNDPPAQLERALQAIALTADVKLAAQSRFYRSPPLGPPGQPEYCNAVCRLETQLPPLALLRELQRIEDAAGRERSGPRWGPRVLDLDLLLYDELVLDTPELKLPHPELHRRVFVLVPLAALAPDLAVPRRGRVADLLAALDVKELPAWRA